MSQNITHNEETLEETEDKINYQYLSTIKQKKKENITPKVWDVSIVYQIFLELL